MKASVASYRACNSSASNENFNLIFHLITVPFLRPTWIITDKQLRVVTQPRSRLRIPSLITDSRSIVFISRRDWCDSGGKGLGRPRFFFERQQPDRNERGLRRIIEMSPLETFNWVSTRQHFQWSLGDASAKGFIRTNQRFTSQLCMFKAT